MVIKMNKILILIVLFILIGCVNAIPTNDKTLDTKYLGELSSDTNIHYGVYSFIDTEHDNICYIFVAYYKGGISCVPLIK